MNANKGVAVADGLSVADFFKGRIYATRGRVIVVSMIAARALGMMRSGVIRVSVE
jgi:hypothetical protein